MINRPKVLLIGAGRFGKNHLKVLRALESKGRIDLVGVITRSNQNELTEDLLKSVDAVSIITPIDTHYGLVKRCLKYCHVFVEKPLTRSYKESNALAVVAKENKKILTVGHIFRYHPVSKELKKLEAEMQKLGFLNLKNKSGVIRLWYEVGKRLSVILDNAKLNLTTSERIL